MPPQPGVRENTRATVTAAWRTILNGNCMPCAKARGPGQRNFQAVRCTALFLSRRMCACFYAPHFYVPRMSARFYAPRMSARFYAPRMSARFYAPRMSARFYAPRFYVPRMSAPFCEPLLHTPRRQAQY